MDDSIAWIREFIGSEPAKGSNAFLASYKQNGRAFIRQVSCYVEGWTVGTIASHDSTKVMQLRDNPAATYLWVESCQESTRRRNVWMSGDITVVDDPDQVLAFLQRREQGIGLVTPQRAYQRVVLQFQPNYLRAEGFRNRAGFQEVQPAVILREFPA